MTPDRFRRVRDLFEAALDDHGPGTREPFLSAACGGDLALREEVEQLLAANEAAAGVFDLPFVALDMRVDSPHRNGSRIGHYEVVRELGKGGMGHVYLCRRTDGVYPKLVALKVLRTDHRDTEWRQRFEQERRILASLAHPNIARLFDGGYTPDGLPYYVMEYIDGHGIDRYCDLHHLDVESRLRLFEQVIEAVEAAHRGGVIHRDIKPTNILVTADGVVKLLDFGIAKQLRTGDDDATLWLTGEGLRPMTPEYASPEQIQQGEATRATDVYSLGVVLYELLTGRKPYRLKNRVFHEVLRVVCEEEPTYPSAAAELPAEDPDGGTDPATLAQLRQTSSTGLRKRLSGDIDCILLKALSKEPWRRYNSAGQFGEDIRRHLEGSPVEARSGRYYRLGRRLTRNRGWLVSGLFLVAALLTGGIHVSWPAAYVAAAAASIFAIWQVGADRQLARRIASGPFWPALNGAVIGAFFVSVIGLDAVSGFADGFREGYGAAPSGFDLDRYWEFKLVWCVPLAMLFVRWALRERWAGSPVLDASSRHNRWFGAMAILTTAYIPAKLWLLAPGTLARLPFTLTFLWVVDALLWIFLYALSGRLEFRQHGIVTATSFFPWQAIANYRWEGDGAAVLRLDLRQRHPVFPPVRIEAPAEKKRDIEALLSRFLSDWPRAVT